MSLNIRMSVTRVILGLLLLSSFSSQGQLAASFTADDTSICAPNIVTFTNTSTGATSYLWDLGNGVTSSSKDVSGTYATPGTYIVKMTATAGASSKTYTLSVNAYGKPSVNFSGSPRSVCPGGLVSFSNTSVANCWGTLTYTWNFGEGGSSTAGTPTYAYASPGSYNVTLLARNNGGCLNSLSMANYIFVYTPAAIGFGATPAFLCKAPGTATFTNTTTGTPPLTYTWSFGDGGASALKTPSHTYTTSGTIYDVTLSVTDGNGCVDSLVNTALVTTGTIKADFYAPHDTCPYIPVTFYNTSTSHQSVKWTFGDGGNASGDTVTHVYSTTGLYTVKMVIKDGTCSDSVTKTVSIARPSGSAAITPVAPCAAPVTRVLNASMPAGSTATWTSYLQGPLGNGNPFSYSYPPVGVTNGGVIDAYTLLITDKFGCKDSIANVLDTINSGQVVIVATRASGCVPVATTFSASAVSYVYTLFGNYGPLHVASFPYPYPPVGYVWDFGDGSPTSTSPTPSHIYTAEAVYSVSCTMTTANGCTIKSASPYKIKAGATMPSGSFNISATRACAGQPLTFTSTSTGVITDYLWFFGNGDVDTGMVTTYKYRVPGKFRVSLQVTNNGCQTPAYPFLDDTIDAPGAEIALRHTCIPPNRVSFSDSSIGDDGRLWMFGDGGTSTLAKPVHDFPALFNYTVRLATYNNTTGCRDTNSYVVYLQRLKPSVFPVPYSTCVGAWDTLYGQIVNVYGNGEGLIRYAILDSWYVNGVFSGSTMPDLDENPRFSYDTTYVKIPRFGKDTVSLIVSDNNGCLDTATAVVTGAKPKANFTYSPSGGCAPLNVTFRDASTDAPGISFSTYAWDFGNDSVASVTTLSATSQYTAAGTYKVTEIVTDIVGCSDTLTRSDISLAVNAPHAVPKVSQPVTCVGLDPGFDAGGSTFGTYFWQFGDGGTSTLVKPAHSYSSPGVYDVTLTVTNGPCSDVSVQKGYITVNAIPKASFKVSDSFSVCPPLSVNFTNTSTGATSYAWSLGDGTFSAATSPSDIYNSVGRYKIRLQAVNQYGCTDTAVAYTSIFGYSGAFSYSPLKTCGLTPVKFTSSISGVAKVKWDFADGIVDSVGLSGSISHYYNHVGSYVPTLILTDGAGCTSISVGADTIKMDTLIPYSRINPSPACMNSSVSFADSSYSFNTPVTSWLWQFGTGATSTLSSVSYTYTATGTYVATLSVKNGSGCNGAIAKVVQVLAQPTANTGNTGVCVGLTTTLSNTVAGGKWTTSVSSVATVDSNTGVVSGRAPGNTLIQYKLPSGCFAATTVTVYPIPDTIMAGTHRVCERYTYTLSDRSSGGVWTSSNTTSATINSSTGVVSGVNAGTTVISYTTGGGCPAFTTITVDPTPGPISGPNIVCVGTTIALTDLPAGGVWTSSSPVLATVGSSTGIVTGMASGLVDTTVVIIYTLPSGCPNSAVIKVNPAMPAIIGNHACVGSVSQLSDASPGGTWSSDNTTVATVTFGTGQVTGKAQGTSTITYTSVIGCVVTTTVTVDTLPPSISGAKQVCEGGGTTTLSDGIFGGTWSIATTTIATVGASSGVVTGKTNGTAVISYTIGTGCKISATVTVNPNPGSIIKTSFTVCAGADVTIFEITPGGAWSSSNTTVFSVAPAPGIGVAKVTGVSPGTATVSYTLSTGCYAVTTYTVISLQVPRLSPPATTPELCASNTITLTDTGGGTWSSSNTLIAKAGSSSGVVTGISAGTVTISYLIASSGCKSSLVVTVDPVPATIGGPAKLCVTDTGLFTNSLPGGAWTSTSPSVASIGLVSGKITAITPGTATITYMMPTTCFAVTTITVNPLPAPIPGAATCVDGRITMSDASSPGQWSSGNTVIATIDAITGSLLGANPGTATITYQLTTGCMTTTAITVNPSPAAITGVDHICLGDTVVLSDLTMGGTFTTSDPGVTLIRPDTGVVSGLSAGTATISYTLGTGCYAPLLFTVYAIPTDIGGAKHLCMGSVDTLTNTIPGAWSSDNTAIATIDANGYVTGAAVGTAGITFTAAGNCTAMTTVTVYPVLEPIAGDTIVCIGAKITLSEAVKGGQWNSSDTSMATIDILGSVTGRSPGITMIGYTLANSCGDATMKLVVAPLPYAGVITGSGKVCTNTTMRLEDTIRGGRWRSGDSRLATVDTSGMVTGVSPGVDTIYYTYANRCGSDRATFTVTVSQAAATAHIIVHPDTVLCGNTLFQNFGADSPEPPGGRYVWSVDNGVVYAVSPNKQNCLISFYSPGTAIVRLSSQYLSSDCASEDAIAYHIGDEQPRPPVVVYYDPEFVCTDYTSDSYQWGYDNAGTLDSVIIPGAVNENYYEPKPDLKNKYYWVITHHKGCLQKSYYNVPLGVKNVVFDGLNIKLYPNPADDILYMEVTGMDRSAPIDFRVTDVTGRERNKGTLAGGTGIARLSGLVPGVYMVSFTYNGAVIGTGVFVKK